MTALRQQFINLRQAQGISSHTQKMYRRAVRQLAEYYHLSPDRLSDEQIHQYLRYLRDGKQLAEGTIMQLLCGMKLFYTQILKRPWTPFSQRSGQPQPPRTSHFPTELRQRFIEDVQLQGLSARTQQAYARTVRCWNWRTSSGNTARPLWKRTASACCPATRRRCWTSSDAAPRQ